MKVKEIYRTITPRRLCSPEVVSRTPIARLLYVHLNCGKVTCQVPGLVEAGVLSIAGEMRLDPQTISDALDELVKHGLAQVDVAAGLIRLPGVHADFARLGRTRNNVVGWINTMKLLPRSRLRDEHARDLRAVCSEDLQALWDAPETHALWGGDTDVPALPEILVPASGRSDPVRTSEQEQEQEPAHTTRPREAAQPPLSIGTQLRQTREALGWPIHFVAGKLGVTRSRIEAIEDDRITPSRAELERFADLYGHPPLAQLPLPEREPDVVHKVVAEHHRRAVELGRAKPGPPPAPTAADIKHVLSTGEGEQTLTCWMTVLARWQEVISRRGDKALDQFTLSFLARAEVRQDILANADLDRPRETSRAPPSRAVPSTNPVVYAPGKFKKDDDDDAS